MFFVNYLLVWVESKHDYSIILNSLQSGHYNIGFLKPEISKYFILLPFQIFNSEHSELTWKTIISPVGILSTPASGFNLWNALDVKLYKNLNKFSGLCLPNLPKDNQVIP